MIQQQMVNGIVKLFIEAQLQAAWRQRCSWLEVVGHA